jgi:L-alanine-DL-glutamate epimerase-like enolase superfamily enzyme
MTALATAPRTEAAIDRLDVSAYVVPTDEPEEDGTFRWAQTTMIVCQVEAGGETGLGYTYGDLAVATLIDSTLAEVVRGHDALDVRSAWDAMNGALRNAGRPGLGTMAVSAVDIALWDLKARLLDEPLVTLIGARHTSLPVYGSGGFTSYSLDRLRRQLSSWVAEGIPRVKMKVGRDPERDPARLDAAREAVGEAQLYVDANGALTRKQALDWAHRFRDEWNVTWFEEPVSSDDLDGLRLVRDHGPGGLEVAAGEYGFMLPDFARLAAAVDCLQADVTRCGGITALQQVDGVSAAAGIDLSAHCAPAVSASAFGAVQRLRHLEYFHDHVRVEGLLLAGVPEPRGGLLEPDRSRPGHGLELKRADAERYEA